MYFLRQIILDTKVNPKKIPKIPENMICLETPERSSETEGDGVLWLTDQVVRYWHGFTSITGIRTFPVSAMPVKTLRNWTGITWRRYTADIWGFPGIF